MDAVVRSVRYDVIATTREECYAKLDELWMNFADHLGGAPWVMSDDDVKKTGAMDAGTPLLADDQGFVYYGMRSYYFRGPVKGELGRGFHEGNTPQRGVDDGNGDTQV